MQGSLPFPDISPEVFSLSLFGFEFALRWYALAYIFGLLLGWALAVRALKAERLWPDNRPPMRPAQVEDLLTWVIIGVIVGGRLGYVLFYQPGYFFANPSQILRVWDGGMAFHGGLLGVVLAAWLFSRAQATPVLSTADILALATPIGLLLGRIANFINAELWGMPTQRPWGVIFPTDPKSLPRHPSQLYEAALEGLVLLVILVIMAWRFNALKAPGRIAGTFFAGYGIARFIVEYFRESDPQFYESNPWGYALHWGEYGVSIGQLLSLPMIAIGVILLAISTRRARTLSP